MARMSYMGSCYFPGEDKILQCTSMNSAVENSIQFYEHVIGLRDKGFENQDSKGPEGNDKDKAGGYNQIQKRIFRYSPSIFKAKFSGPISTDPDDGTANISDLVEKAIDGTTITKIDFLYISGLPGWSGDIKGHEALDLVIEQLNINVASADVATFDISVVAIKNEKDPVFTIPTLVNCEKLLTWDKCNITTTNVLSTEIESFSLSIKNTIIPIYVSGQFDPSSVDGFYYWPKELRLGTQEVTGTISSYEFKDWQTDQDTITIKLGASQWQLKAYYNTPQSSAAGGPSPYVSPVNFIGINDGPVWIKQ